MPPRERYAAIVYPPKLDGIYRAEQRGASHHTRTRAETVARELLEGDLRINPGKAQLPKTRKEVERGWFAVSDTLMAEGRKELANAVRRFATEMPLPMTERERIAEDLRKQVPEVRTPGHALHLTTSR